MNTCNLYEWSNSKNIIQFVINLVDHNYAPYSFNSFSLKSRHNKMWFIFMRTIKKEQLHLHQKILRKMPSKEKNADCVSCSRSFYTLYDNLNYLYFMEESDISVDSNKVEQKSIKNGTLSKVRYYVKRGWPSKVISEQLKPYFRRRNELTVEQDCLLLIKKQFLFIINVTAKWIQCWELKNITAANTIKYLRETFSLFGSPKEVTTDNRTFLEKSGVKQDTI